MNLKSLKVVVTRKLPMLVEKRMSELFDVDLRENVHPMSYENLTSAVTRADVLVPSLGDKLNEHVLFQANSRLKLIANYGAGFDHIDIKAAINERKTFIIRTAIAVGIVILIFSFVSLSAIRSLIPTLNPE